MEAAERLARFFLDGDCDGAIQLIKQQPNQDWMVLYRDLFTPAMYEIGELWEKNEISVADEHLATGICDFVLSRLFQIRKKTAPSKKAMFLCLQGEQHYLGLKMVNNLFEERGWETKYFGSSLPLEYARQTALEWKPEVIGLSVSIVYNLPNLNSYVKTLSALPHKPHILVGGRLAHRYDLSPYTEQKAEILTNLRKVEEWFNRFEKKGPLSDYERPNASTLY
ncbi:cobalamin B12-binding domain-containing protein [Priestia abyssalis]|uniref:cobalamin B12-binding domain-containing protein n=1 Tax=Priestia abyssalis TaxID=1221450 RepID=UPI000994CAF8|nr:B12-binding domain-containing protein [Priestia abyssalis]